jgi:sodium-dependent dicarboxylate transporter 2/3/5
MGERVRFRDLFEAREMLSEAELRFERRRRTAGLGLGPALFLALLLARPFGLESHQSSLVAVLAWVLTWWITEAVPIPITALLGPSLAVVLGVEGAKAMFAPFGDPIIFLFLGSFVIAEAMSTSGLDRRFAYAILGGGWVGSSSTRILVAFATIVALLSMWLSNTATTAMMYPIAMGVLVALTRLLERSRGGKLDLTRLRYGTSLMLVTAYAASIGGIATPVGTPPNLITLGLLDSLAHRHVSFFQWMVLATPVMIVMLVLLLVYMRWALPPEVGRIAGSREHILAERAALGTWSRAERNVMIAFGVTVALWVLPGIITLIIGQQTPLAALLGDRLPEATVALLGAGLLFVLPVDWKQRRFTLSWNEAVRIDWGTLLLFGGGLSLGGAMFQTGLAKEIGHGLIRLTGAHTLVALCFLFAFVAIVITETTSNTASATMLAPLAIAAAQAAGVSPVAPAATVALACSMAFMLPVSTPPNAIVYGSGYVPITAMLRHGAVLDLASAVLVPVGVLLMCHVLGL